MRLPYDRARAGRGPGRAITFPPGVVTGDPEPGPVSRRRRAKPLVVLAVFLTEAALMTANALWWQFSGPWFLTGVLLGNIVVASLLTNWITIL